MSDTNDFLNSVLIDIKDAYQAKANKTVYSVPEKWESLIEDVADNLRNRDNPYTVEVDGKTLYISWG